MPKKRRASKLPRGKPISGKRWLLRKKKGDVVTEGEGHCPPIIRYGRFDNMEEAL